MLRILGRTTSSNVQKVLWYLDELSLPCQREDYGGSFGGNREAAFLQLNPNGTVPVLIDGDVVIWESNTILRYLANRQHATASYPADPWTRARCEQWMDWQLGTLNPTMTTLYIGLVRTPREEQNQQELDQLRHRARQAFSIVDGALADSRFLVGEQLTLADICLGMFAYRWFTLPLDRGQQLGHLHRWYRRLQERPGYRQHIMIGLA